MRNTNIRRFSTFFLGQKRKIIVQYKFIRNTFFLQILPLTMRNIRSSLHKVLTILDY